MSESDLEKRREERKKREEARRKQEEEEEKQRQERKKNREKRRLELDDTKKEAPSTSSKKEEKEEEKHQQERKESKAKNPETKSNINTADPIDTESPSFNIPRSSYRRGSLPNMENESAPPSLDIIPKNSIQPEGNQESDKNLRKVRSTASRPSEISVRRRESSQPLETTVTSIGFDIEEKQFSFSTENDQELNSKIQKKWKLKPEEYEIFDVSPTECLLLPRTKVVVFFDDQPGEPQRINLRTKALAALTIFAPIFGFAENQYVISTKKSTDSKFYLRPKKTLLDQGIYADSVIYLIKDPAEAQKQIKKSQNFLSSISGSKKKEEFDYSPSNVISKMKKNEITLKIFQKITRSCILSPSFAKNFASQGGISELFSLLGNSRTDISREDIILVIDILLSHDEELITEIGKIPMSGKKLLSCYKLGSGDGIFLKEIILGILTNLCFEYLQKVLDGFRVLDDVRFSSLIDDLNHVDNLNFKANLMFLINTILSSLESVEERVFIRRELFKLELENVLEKLKNLNDIDLEEQIKIFEEDQTTDKEELSLLAEKNFKGVDYKDIDSLWPALRKAIKGQDFSEEKCLSILKRLLTITEADDIKDEHRKSIWKTLDKIVEKLVNLEENENPEDVFIPQEEFQIIRQNNDEQVEELRKKINLFESGAENPKIKELEQKIENLSNERRKVIEEKLQMDELFKKLSNEHSIDISTSNLPLDSGTPAPFDSSVPPPPPFGNFNENSAPPPPPPFGNFNENSAPPPPPPFGDSNAPPLPPAPFENKSGHNTGQSIPNLPPKPVIKPHVKLKKLNWKKIPNNKILSTIWVEAKDVIELDTDSLEFQFAAKENFTLRKGEGDTSLPKKVTILDGKRSNQIGISLSKFKMDHSRIKEALVHLDDSLINSEQISMLTGPLTFLPTPEEINAVMEYSGDRETLDKPEKFILALADIPLLLERAEFWHIARSFDERVHILLPNINSLLKSFKEVMTSSKLIKVLEVILAVGNYLNGGTFNGRAYGFTLESLLKLVDTKSSDSKTTLLHYIIKTVESKFPSALDWQKDLPTIEKASKIPESTLREEHGLLRNGVKKSLKLLETIKEQKPLPEQNVELLLRLQKFSEQAEQKEKVIEGTLNDLAKTFERLCLKFGEDPEKFKIQEFFTLITGFVTQWNHTLKDIEQIKQEANRRPVGRIGKRQALKIRGSKNLSETSNNNNNNNSDSPTHNLKKRVEIRRTESIRRVSEHRSSKRNLNNLLDMLSTMETKENK